MQHLTIFALLILAACGGGGNGGAPPPDLDPPSLGADDDRLHTPRRSLLVFAGHYCAVIGG